MHPVPIASFTHKFPGLDHYHSDYGVAFSTDEEPANRPADGESNTIECFTLGQLEALPDNEIPGNVVEIGRFLLTEGIEYWDQTPTSEWSLDTPAPHFEPS